ncbi:MAG TPA: hypothetical protein VEE84_04705, partial [Burkholderiaceae bacterium]|nr:hypothetical protein [Burkholderiaceae bacterium]
MITAGIDVGSRSVKVVLVEDAKVEGAPQLKYVVRGKHLMFPGDLDADVAAEKALCDALSASGIERGQVASIFATGAGRKMVKFAKEAITEMSAGAKG